MLSDSQIAKQCIYCSVYQANKKVSTISRLKIQKKNKKACKKYDFFRQKASFILFFEFSNIAS